MPQGSDGELEEGEHETTDQSTDGELDDVCVDSFLCFF